MFSPFLFLPATSKTPPPVSTCLAPPSLDGAGGGGRVTCYGCYCCLSWWLGERSWGDVLTVSSNADTGESPTVRQGIVLLAPVTPGRGEDFLENVARTVWRRRGVGSRPARKLQEEGHGCVRGAVSPSGARTEARDGNWKCAGHRLEGADFMWEQGPLKGLGVSVLGRRVMFL